MKAKLLSLLMVPSLAFSVVNAQNNIDTVLNQSNKPVVSDKYVESDVVPLAGKSGFSFRTKAGDFLFKPYALVQTSAELNYYDDEGLNLADQDNIANSGFAIPNAILGLSGKAFNIVTFHMALNCVKSGANLLNQAWFDVNLRDELRFRVGKFKTPMHSGYLTTMGQTMFPSLPLSLTQTVNVYESLNAVNPTMSTGFDTGVMMHGLLGGKWDYRLGIFNGSGSGSNSATKTMSDDNKWLPSLLYAARIAYMPKGDMPTHQGSSDDLNNNKLLFALSSSYNVEAEDESSNDYRGGFEFAWLYKRLYVSGEAYLLKMNWQDRMLGIGDDKVFWGAYAQAGYFITPKLQGVARYDFFDRNSTDIDGILDMPAVGVNYFFSSCNLKFQFMYQYLGKYGHETQLERDNDDLGLPMNKFMALLQYSF